MYPQDGTDANALTNNADNAMYDAKRNGKNGYRIYRSNSVHRVFMNLDDQKQTDRS